jgi:DeoR family suf operon transcriptional repressor
MLAPLPTVESSDRGLLDLLRKEGALGIAELASAMDVTATAVRQRLGRLMGLGLITRETSKPARGRPSHRYALTDKALRQAGNNFVDLSLALWQEIRSIKDPEIRGGLLKRLSERMANEYRSQIQGDTLEERFESVVALFGNRNIPLGVEYVQRVDYVGTNLPGMSPESAGSSTAGCTPTAADAGNVEVVQSSPELPILSVWACPYPQLAEMDRGICSLEKMLLTDLLGTRVKLTECRLDGGNCCRFQTAAVPDILENSVLTAS